MASRSSNPKMTVNVRYNSANSVAVEVDPNWNVGRLKEEISKIKRIPKNEVRIIFQGREVHDSLTIQHCDLGNNSVIHAVQRTDPLTIDAEIPSDIPTESLGLMPSITEIPEAYKSQFYVYCKDNCNDVKPGKIRVRCKKCRNGAFEVDRDPDGWHDVLEPNQITGICHDRDKCDGTFAEFYFKCKAHEVGEQDTSAVLNLIRPNMNHVPCITCYNECNPVIVWPCREQHTMCLECFKHYTLTKLNERGFVQRTDMVYTVPCPGPDTECNEAFVKEPHHFRILGSQEYERYKNFATEEFVLQSGGVLCPNRDCGAPMMPEHTYRRIQCQFCMHVFCRNCKEAYHSGDCPTATEASASGSSVTVNHSRAAQSRYDLASRDEVKKISKPCPKCAVPTERNGGCMHMTCTRCKFNWCWLCRVEWGRQCQSNHWFGAEGQ